jgi:hypothetical protein
VSRPPFSPTGFTERGGARGGEPPIRELRDLTRYRKALANERTREVNRIHKTLEDAG